MNKDINRKVIIDGLHGLGARTGMSIMVHSSLKSIGRVDGGADTVIDALLEAVGPSGTVLMPTMTYGSSSFNAETTPSETGLISETFRKRPDALRSMNPTHSIAGIGPDAERLLDGHDADLPYGPNGFGSPLDKLVKAGGHVLLLGVSHVRNTTCHLILYYEDIPFLEDWREIKVIAGDGSTQYVKTRHAGCSEGFENLHPALVEAGVIASRTIGNAEVRLMKGQDLLDVGRNALRKNPALMFCGDFRCKFCGYAASELAV